MERALLPTSFGKTTSERVRIVKTSFEMFTVGGQKLLSTSADDNDIAGTIHRKEEFGRLEKISKKMGLKINEAKPTSACLYNKEVKIG